MSSREAILGRVREALRTGNRPESLLAESEPDNGITAARQVLPMVPADFEGQVELFSELSIALKTEFLRSADEKAAKGLLSALVDREKWESLAFTLAGIEF